MHQPFAATKILRAVVGVTLVLAAVVLASSSDTVFKTSQKAYYADVNTINFVRPGLIVKVTGAAIASDGTISARMTMTDPRGLPLDREGIVTPGPVTGSLIAAYIPAGKTQYVAYTTRQVTSPITRNTATQAAGENNGRWTKHADGDYTYTFTAKAPANIERNATHTIGVYFSRNLSEFDLGTDRADAVFNFVPDGSNVTTVRDIVKTGTCNNCHNPLALHGGPRRSVELCILCHTPQSSDPDTGHTVDMAVMIHKIHRGADLPSVQAGTPYQIIGNQQSVHDYSTVVFPPGTNECSVCHKDDVSQKMAYMKPSRAACGSCHDNVNFATGANHADLPQVSDNQCATCHTPEGELEFDVSIKGAHVTPTRSRDLPGTVFELIRVTNGTPGNKPSVTFSIKDKSGKPILPNQMTRLGLVLAGPTSDYAGFVSEDARSATGATEFTYTFNAALPANASGSYSIGIEGYRNVTLLPGTRKETIVRDAGLNKVISFAAGGGPVEQRRKIVDLAKCNDCHLSLNLHGGNRNAIEQCVLCHNPNQTDAARRPASEGPPETVDMRTMIHRIHTGHELTRPYAVFGFGGAKLDFGHVGYPGDRRDCTQCHVNGSENLPLNENLLPVQEPRGYFSPVGPVAAACLGCHTSRDAASHAYANTTTIGESCGACHGPNSQFSVARSHAR